MALDPNTIECGRCGRTYAWDAHRAGKMISCECGEMVALPVKPPGDEPMPQLDDDDLLEQNDEQDEALTGVMERNLPEGLLWLFDGTSGLDAILLTESELRLKTAIAGSEKKFDKLMEKKGSIGEVVKNKWTTTIPLDAITSLERADLDSFAIIHYRVDRKTKQMRVQKEGSNIHAIVFDSLHTLLAPDRQPVLKKLSTWEIVAGPLGCGVITLIAGAVLIGASLASGAPTGGKSRFIWWIATTLGTVGCVALTAIITIGVITWAVKRFKARPMKAVVQIENREE